MRLDSNSTPNGIADYHPRIKCPHCTVPVSLSAISIPQYKFLHRYKPDYVDIGYLCNACNQPVSLRYRIENLGNPIVVPEHFTEIERASETFELEYLPAEVASDFDEALKCYSANCMNAFASMCRRSLQSSAQELGAEGSTRVQTKLRILDRWALSIRRNSYN